MNTKHKILASFEDFITTNQLIKKGNSILLSMSAGKDSVLLFNLLMNFKEKYNLTLYIFHLNHCTRGEESDKDENFVIDLAKKNNIKLFNYKYDFSNDKQSNFEEKAREIRYKYINDILSDHKIDIAATAHNHDDNVETCLMRIFSGTSIWGLQSISYKRNNIIRPIIFLTSEEIYSYLKTENIKWREDLSNKENIYRRNFLRNKIILELNTIFPGIKSKVSGLINNAKEHIDLVDNLIKKLNLIEYVNNHKENVTIKILNDYYDNKELFYYIISKILRDNFNFKFTTSILSEIYKNFKSNKSNSLLYKIDNLYIEKTIEKNIPLIKFILNKKRNLQLNWKYNILLNFDNELECDIPDIGETIILKWVDINFFNKHFGKKIIFLSLKDSENQIIIRNKEDGDKIFNINGYKKIKKMFIDFKLSPVSKYKVPLFVIGEEIAAIGFNILQDNFDNKISKNFYVTINSKKILAIYSKKNNFNISI